MHLSVKDGPILAQHVSSGFGGEVETIAKKGVSDGAIPLRPVDIRQPFRHEWPRQTGNVGHVPSIVIACDKEPLHRILHRALF